MANGKSKTVRVSPRKIEELTADLERYVRTYVETFLPRGTEAARRALDLLEVQRIIREGEAEYRAGKTKRLRSLRDLRRRKAGR